MLICATEILNIIIVIKEPALFQGTFNHWSGNGTSFVTLKQSLLSKSHHRTFAKVTMVLDQNLSCRPLPLNCPKLPQDCPWAIDFKILLSCDGQLESFSLFFGRGKCRKDFSSKKIHAQQRSLRETHFRKNIRAELIYKKIQCCTWKIDTHLIFSGGLSPASTNARVAKGCSK